MKKIWNIWRKGQWMVATLFPLSVFAQSTNSWWEQQQGSVVFWSLLTLEVILLFVTLTLFFVVKVLANKVLRPPDSQAEKADTAQKAEEAESSLIKRVVTKLNDAVPVEREAEVLTDHTYDGIHELDNNLPPWWKAMFYATIAFSVVYLVHFHVLDTGDLQTAEYEKEMAAAQAEVEDYLATNATNVDESNVVFVEDTSQLENGHQMFVQKCSPCHGQAGEGGVGPNLTDQYWIHGGDIKDIFRVIKNGVPEKGMIPWKTQLSPTEIQNIASFIITLEGSNPPNAKEAQGELYERKDEVALK